jgi:hypothetical protein
VAQWSAVHHHIQLAVRINSQSMHLVMPILTLDAIALIVAVWVSLSLATFIFHKKSFFLWVYYR